MRALANDPRLIVAEGTILESTSATAKAAFAAGKTICQVEISKGSASGDISFDKPWPGVAKGETSGGDALAWRLEIYFSDRKLGEPDFRYVFLMCRKKGAEAYRFPEVAQALGAIAKIYPVTP